MLLITIQVVSENGSAYAILRRLNVDPELARVTPELPSSLSKSNSGHEFSSGKILPAKMGKYTNEIY